MTTALPPLPIIKNRYRLIEELGQGGMGVVYKARDRLTQQWVALKRLLVPTEYLEFLSKASSENLLLSLAHEFQITASLRHPHIISVLDYGFDTEQQPYLVMELLDEGKPLPEYAHQFPLDDAVRLLIETLHALEYLHHRGIIHRDLKPGNVLVDNQQVKVLDFGLSIQRGQPTVVEGTLPYIAPEVLDGQPVSERSDLYAIGVLAYEMLTGRLPFFHGDVQETIRMIREAPPDLTLVEAESLRPVLARLLAKDPAQRFSSASEVIEALSNAQGISIEESFWLRESFLQAAAFTGRDQELSDLYHALQRAKDGEGSLWLVEGESGIGKSRLLNELRIRALVEGVEVLTGFALNASGKPYQPWREVLHRLALHVSLAEDEIGMLKLIVPEVAATFETSSDIPMPLDDIGKRLLELVVKLFSRLQQPAVVLLEDLQWAGDESLEVLKQLAGNISGLPLLIVGNYRSDERAGLAGDLPGAQVLRLHRLTSDQIADLSVSMLGESGRHPAILHLLERESEGNIFFLIEVLRALAEEAGRLAEVPTMSLPSQVFTQGIQSLIERRLARIPQAYWHMLELSAVSGRYLDTQVLSTLQEQVNDARTRIGMDRFLNLCAAAAVLEVVDNQWRFAHDKIREGILAKIDAARLPDHHLRVAEAIEATYTNHDEFAAALAYHYGSAGRLDKELVYSEIAGKQADHSGAYATAIRYYRRVVDLLPPEDRAKRAVIAGLLGREWGAAGDFAQAEYWLQESLRLAREVDDQKTIVLDLMRLGLLTFETGRSGESGAYLEEALALAVETHDQKLLIRSLVELAHHEANQKQFEAANRHITQALDGLASIEDPETLAFVYWGAGIVATLQESFSEATDYFEQSRAWYQRLDFLSGVLATTNNLGEICRLQGDYQQAWDYFQEVLKHRLAQGRRKSIASTMANLGLTATGLGKYEDAHQYFADSYSIALEIGAPATALVALVGQAELTAMAGDPISAIEVVGFVLAHPASVADVRKDATPILERITTDLEPDQVAAALERGQLLTMDTVASMVFGQDSNPNTAS